MLGRFWRIRRPATMRIKVEQDETIDPTGN